MQLAIERLGVPFDACVVLVDPRRELRPYFNGRHARNLPRREGSEVTELEAIREPRRTCRRRCATTGPPARRSGRSAGCYVVIPGRRRRVARASARSSRAYLERRARVVWADEWVIVHELAPPTAGGGGRSESRGASTCRGETLRGPAASPAAYLEAPASGALLPAHAVTVSRLGPRRERPAVAIEFEVDGELIWRAPVQLERPDVVEAFPDSAVGLPGFQTTLNVGELPAGSVVEVFAAFADGSRAAARRAALAAPGAASRRGR